MKHVKLLGTGLEYGKYEVPFKEIHDYLGPLQDAPKQLQRWTKRIQPVMEQMLGIEKSFFAFNRETRAFEQDNLSLAVDASRQAMNEAGVDPEQIDFIVYGGAYSHQMPALSTRIQEELGIGLAAEMHIHSNCTSVYKAIQIAHAMVKLGEYKNVLVVSSNVNSCAFLPEYYNQNHVSKEDFFLRWFLCDGGAAFVFQAVDEQTDGFYLEDTYIESAGKDYPSAMGNGYSNYLKNPMDEYERGAHHIHQSYIHLLNEYAMESNGRTIFTNALDRMLKSKNISIADLTKVVVNMPSKAIVELIQGECEQMGISKETFYDGLQGNGYIGPPAAIASIHHLLHNQLFEDDDLILSFVMEVSKFLQAGFTLRCVKKGESNESVIG